jgi:hypothetical protein
MNIEITSAGSFVRRADFPNSLRAMQLDLKDEATDWDGGTR